MQAMGDLRGVADEIMRKLADGQLPVTSGASTNSADKTPTPFSAPRGRQSSTNESLTAAQLHRRKLIMLEVVQRYIFDKHLDPLDDDELRAVVKSYDHLFTHAGIPTERIRDVYAEAMAHHGQYLLKVDDYLRAWQSIESAAQSRASDIERGAKCKSCNGTGEMMKFSQVAMMGGDKGFVAGRDMTVDCFYNCPKTTALVFRAKGIARKEVFR